MAQYSMLSKMAAIWYDNGIDKLRPLKANSINLSVSQIPKIA